MVLDPSLKKGTYLQVIPPLVLPQQRMHLVTFVVQIRPNVSLPCFTTDAISGGFQIYFGGPPPLSSKVHTVNLPLLHNMSRPDFESGVGHHRFIPWHNSGSVLPSCHASHQRSHRSCISEPASSKYSRAISRTRLSCFRGTNELNQAQGENQVAAIKSPDIVLHQS
jgi:hypothetical protein